VSAGKSNASEPLMTCRKRKDVVETRLLLLAWDEAREVPADCPSGDRHGGGERPAQRLLWGTWEHCALMPRETSKWQTHEEQSTDAGRRDGRAVRAMKPGNAGRAKGPDSPAEGIGQPAMGGAGA
jgi:hypothetical protein